VNGDGGELVAGAKEKSLVVFRSDVTRESSLTSPRDI